VTTLALADGERVTAALRDVLREMLPELVELIDPDDVRVMRAL